MATTADDEVSDLHVKYRQYQTQEANKFGTRVHFLNVVAFLFIFASGLLSGLGGQFVYKRIEDVYVNRSEIANFSQDSPCSENRNNVSQLQEIQEESAQMQIYLSLAGSLPAVIVVVILGSYSDRLGRRLLLVLPIIGTFVKAIVYCVVSHWVLSLNYLYIGHILDGMTGSFTCFFLALFAMSSDITNKDKQRSFKIAILEACLGLAYGAGSLVLGLMIKYCGYTNPNFLIMAVSLLSMGIVVFVLPETKPRNIAGTTKHGRLSIGNSIYRVFQFYFNKEVPHLRNCYIVCWLIFFITSLTFVGSPGVEMLYQKNAPLCWDSVKIGYFGSIKSVCLAIGVIVLLKLLQLCLGDLGIAVFCGLAKISSFVLQGFANTDLTMYLVAVVGLPAIGMMAMIRSIVSKLTSKEQLGAIFASFACTEALTNLTGGVLFNSVYKATLAVRPGAVFFLMAAILGLVLILYFVLYFLLKKHNRMKQQSITIPDERQPLLENDRMG